MNLVQDERSVIAAKHPILTDKSTGAGCAIILDSSLWLANERVHYCTAVQPVRSVAAEPMGSG